MDFDLLLMEFGKQVLRSTSSTVNQGHSLFKTTLLVSGDIFFFFYQLLNEPQFWIKIIHVDLIWFSGLDLQQQDFSYKSEKKETKQLFPLYGSSDFQLHWR